MSSTKISQNLYKLSGLENYLAEFKFSYIDLIPAGIYQS